MKLLIITQKVDKDDPILGFFHRWIIEFAKHCESIIVICLYEGIHDLPSNVRVLSLGKEKGISRLKYLFNFYKYIINESKNYDTVFVHMNQVYVLLGGIVWRFLDKKIGFWYTHKAVSSSLRMAVILSNDIFTASKESFRLKTKKLHVVGHGIDVDKFSSFTPEKHSIFTIISVGRITRIKNLETLIHAISIIKKEGFNFSYKIIGPKVNKDDHAYFEELKKIINSENLDKDIDFIDAVSNDKIGEYYSKADLNINLSPTGGMDKVVLEGIVSGVLPIVSNKTFTTILSPYNKELIFDFDNSEDLANKIISASNIENKPLIKDVLKKKVEYHLNLRNLVRKILDILL